MQSSLALSRSLGPKMGKPLIIGWTADASITTSSLAKRRNSEPGRPIQFLPVPNYRELRVPEGPHLEVPPAANVLPADANTLLRSRRMENSRPFTGTEISG